MIVLQVKKSQSWDWECTIPQPLLIVSGNEDRVLGLAGIVSRNASRNMCGCVQGKVQLVFSCWNEATWTT